MRILKVLYNTIFLSLPWDPHGTVVTANETKLSDTFSMC